MKKLDLYLANIAVANIKLHNLHWNVKGFAFKQVHEYLETLYDVFFEKFDEVAELQKQLGKYPLASMKDYLEISTIQELESKDYSLQEAIEITKDLLVDMRSLALEIREEADEKDQFQVANLMEDDITGYDKEIWFVESMLG